MRASARKKPVRAIQRRKPAHIQPHKQPVALKAAPPTIAESIERVLIGGDLSPLSPEERVQYHNAVCKSLGLNPLTGPFLYILFREAESAPAKLQLYATKDCAAQLRKIHRISVLAIRREVSNGMSTVEADVCDGTGKKDTAIGVVPLWKWKDRARVDLTGREYANAIMKTETKAKRRATLSICGLAFLDESELDTMQIVGGVTRDGRVFEYKQPQLPEASEPQQSLEAGAELYDEAVALARTNTSDVPFKEKVKQAEQDIRKKNAVPQEPTPAIPSLFYRHHQESDTWEIFGDRPLQTANKDILMPLWDGGAKAIIAKTAKELAHLIREFEIRKVPFKDVTPNREPGVD